MGWGPVQRGLRGSPLLEGCATAALLLVVLVTSLAVAQGYDGRPDLDRTAQATSVAATAFFIAAGLTRVVCWRITSEAGSGYTGAALLAFGILALLLSAGANTPPVVTFAVTLLIALAVLAAVFSKHAAASSSAHLARTALASTAPPLVVLAGFGFSRTTVVHGPGLWLLTPGALLATIAGTSLVRAMTALDRATTRDQLRLATVAADRDRARAALDAQQAWRRELSHDASNAMAALRLATSVMTTHDGRLAPERVETLQAAVLGEISHLDHLINRTSQETPADFDVLATVEPIAAAQRLGGLDVSVVGERVRAHGNAADLATVVQNLLVNARRHGLGGAVTIRTERRDGTVGMVVEDQGPGVPEQQRRRIFDDGVRGEASEGSGLGLYVARRLMREQGGSIELGPPDAGRGASFVLTMPAADVADHRVQVSR